MPEMKTLNGYEIVDANARNRLDALEKGGTGGAVGSITLVDDGEGNFTIVTTGSGTVNLVDDGEGNFTLEVA